MTWFDFAIISAFLSSLSAIIEKKTLSHIHAMDFSIALSLCTAVLSLPLLIGAHWETLTPLVLLTSFGVSLLGAFGFIGVTRGLRHLEISTSSSLFLLGPFITALLAFLFLGEKLSSLQLFGIICLMGGTYILETQHIMRFGEFWRNITENRYTRYTLVGLLLYGFSGIGDRIVLGHLHVDAVLYTALIQILLALQFIAIALYYRRGVGEAMKNVMKEWKMFALIAILTTGYRLMQAQATALAAIGLVVAVKRSSAFFTTVIGGELFHEKNLVRKSVACLIMIGGVFLIAFK